MSFICATQSFGTNVVITGAKLAGGGIVGFISPTITNAIYGYAIDLFQKNNERNRSQGAEMILPISIVTAICSYQLMSSLGSIQAVGSILGSGMFMGLFIICSSVGGR